MCGGEEDEGSGEEDEGVCARIGEREEGRREKGECGVDDE